LCIVYQVLGLSCVGCWGHWPLCIRHIAYRVSCIRSIAYWALRC